MTKKGKGSGQKGPVPLSLKMVGLLQEKRSKGWKIDAIAKYYGLSHGSVSYYVRSIKPPPLVSQKQHDQMRLLRTAGFSFKEISTLTKFSISTVKKHCGDVVLPGHYAGNKLPDVVIAQIQTLRSEGIPFMTIAERLNVGWGTVIRYAKDIPVPKRNKGHTINEDEVRQIALMHAAGHTPAEIAEALDISKITANKYVKKLNEDPKAADQAAISIE